MYEEYSSAKARLSCEHIKEIKAKYTGKRGEKVKLAKEYNCSPTMIGRYLKMK